MSKQRTAVYQVLQQGEGHMTAQQIYDAARVLMPSIALGTVYRNLEQMVQQGVVKKIVAGDGPAFFDRTCHPHDHLLCVSCGKLRDLPGCSLLSQLQQNSGLALTGYSLTAHYVCDGCKQHSPVNIGASAV